ncbi:hypothetical protein VOLCADRAFT_102136 [Volvox carteri f. nagariensis]|uniref:C2 domain-containing protein n=1 Tax=Volvox carteri f. nagariensis TaxID=3068 RepID=D8U473_VOLCA|nr:uncharacterized protein VOLCADRAFT_102136 [Volvox carteri f. nagariensis]EFJ45452.1 hypothetical protein VOLCADRAFT_102136 [Volvox carteri f. nagariensis]|eukprot:XP_002953479.1 hypothetical protein VOLCADRAFT_102136 [Volvox carteri f. nagariensis]
MAGKLCVSVIEARNLQADDFAEKNFYVKLRVGSNEVKTDVVKGSLQPKFLKDCRLSVPLPETDILRIELLQVGPRGDLVVGSDDLRILTITSRGTIVHWFQLRTAGRDVSAELCLVLRYLSAGAHRPMSPTYAIAARQAKERALEGPPAPQTPSTSAFRDLPSAAAPGGTSTSGRLTAASSPADQQGSSATAAAAGTRGPMAAGPGMARGPPRQQVSSTGSRRPGRPSDGSRSGPTQVPLPLAVLGGMVVGALVYLWKKRPVYYEVQEDDTLCHIASCFKKRVEDVYQKNKALLKNPSRLYPGDRLRIR